MKLSITTLSTAVVLAAAAMHAPQAQAATTAANATGFCQGALPVFDTELRKRPLGLNNEGDAGAYVSCSVPVPHNPDTTDNAVIYMTNRNAAAVDVSCIFVDGVVADSGFPTGYYPQTISLNPGIFTAMVWLPGDFGLTSFSGYTNFSCNLPAGVELNLVGSDYTDSP